MQLSSERLNFNFSHLQENSSKHFRLTVAMPPRTRLCLCLLQGKSKVPSICKSRKCSWTWSGKPHGTARTELVQNSPDTLQGKQAVSPFTSVRCEALSGGEDFLTSDQCIK